MTQTWERKPTTLIKEYVLDKGQCVDQMKNECAETSHRDRPDLVLQEQMEQAETHEMTCIKLCGPLQRSLKSWLQC